MKLKLFCVRDSKVGAYMQPFTQRSTAEALRSFGTAVNDKSTNFHRYPADFHLFEIGSFNEDNGSLEPIVPVALACALDLQEQVDFVHEAARQTSPVQLATKGAI